MRGLREEVESVLSSSRLGLGFSLVALSLQLVALCLVNYKVTLGLFSFGLILTVGLVMKANEPNATNEQRLPVETQSRQPAEVEVYRQMEALDEQQIIDEQKGHVILQYFYSFLVGGREIIGISWAGIKFIASKMAKQGHPIAVQDLLIEDTQDSYKARAKAKDLATGEERWGVAEQPKVDERGRRNMFAYPIAASKAQRNAIRCFISEVVIQEGYREWKKGPIQRAEPTKDVISKEQQAPGTSSTTESPVPEASSPIQKEPPSKQSENSDQN